MLINDRSFDGEINSIECLREANKYWKKAHEAGRPQPTLCKHGGEAEPAQAPLKRLLALFASSLRSSQ